MLYSYSIMLIFTKYMTSVFSPMNPICPTLLRGLPLLMCKGNANLTCPLAVARPFDAPRTLDSSRTFLTLFLPFPSSNVAFGAPYSSLLLLPSVDQTLPYRFSFSLVPYIE